MDALAAGDAFDRVDRIFRVDVDEVIRPELLAEIQSRVARSGEDHRLRAERLADRDGHQSDRARPCDDQALSGNQAGERVEGVHGGAGSDDQRRLFVADSVGNVHQGVDVVDRILGESAVGGEAVGAVTLVVLAVIHAVVEAGRVHAGAAALAASATEMHFHRHPIADRVFVDPGPELDHPAYILMARREVLVERQATLDECRRPARDDPDVSVTDGDGVDAHQHFGRPRLRHRLLRQPELAGVVEHPGSHRGRDDELVAAGRRFHASPHREVLEGLVIAGGPTGYRYYSLPFSRADP